MTNITEWVSNLVSGFRERFEHRPIRHRPNDTYDERDTMFARAAREAESSEYQECYERRPDLQATDDRIRRKPPLGSSDSLFYDQYHSQNAAEYFEAIEEIEPDTETVDKWTFKLESAARPEPVLESLTQDLGAVDVGFTTLPSEYIYSHAGRFDENYGEPVTLDHQYAVVFLVEMDHDTMAQAPKPPVLEESAKQYYRAASIAKTLTAVLRSQGAEATPQYDAHYEVMLPPLAVEAGLGELGRNNILIADRYGSRVRIGAVTTNYSLRSDEPVSLGVERFCRSCTRCASACPARALETGPKHSIRGTEKWPTDETHCYSFWRQAGTDCGICMHTCPFSHPNSRLHNTTRQVLSRAPWLAPVFLRLDEWLYDRSPTLSLSRPEEPKF